VRFFSGTFLRLLDTYGFQQPQKRRKQPERYAKYNPKFFKNYTKRLLR
jgi:hypothetical protein